MMQITPHMRILLAANAVDFRKGIDGLIRICRNVLAADPFSGTVFAFTNKSRTAIRILVYDGQGFWLCHKRLSTGRFVWPKNGLSLSLCAQQLQMLLWNSDPFGIPMKAPWKKIPIHPKEKAGDN